MSGGSQAVSQWQDETVVGVHSADDAGTVDVAEAAWDEEAPPPDRRPRIAAGLAITAAIGWLVLFVSARWPGLQSGLGIAEIAALIVDGATPLMLIVLFYMLAVRTSRTEATRFARVSGDLRGEQARLDTVLERVATQLEAQREAVAAQADALMTIGDDAAARLRAVGDQLTTDVAALARDADALQRSATAARNETTALLGDLPRVQAQTHKTTIAIEAAGLAAHERAGALEAQVSALVARGREADDIAGGAAQKLAAHLARVDGVSRAASTQLATAAEAMTTAINASLTHAAEAGEATRGNMDAQGAAIRALVEQSEAALARIGADASDALATRVEEVRERLESLGAMLVDHEATSTKLVYGVASGIDRIDERFAAIDEGAEARETRLSDVLGALAQQADTLATALDRGSASADAMIGKTETLMTALDGTVRELEDTLPAAFARMDASADTSRAKIAEVSPEVTRIEREASAALDRLIDAEKLLTDQRAALDLLGTTLDDRLNKGKVAAGDLVAAVEGADARARELADSAGATLIDAMVRVRETAQTAADRAREALAAVVPDSADRLSEAVKDALGKAVTSQVEAQIGELAAKAEGAVQAANAASDRLMRQMLTIAETSAQVEARIAEAHAEIDEADRDNFSRRVALLIESLNSTSIDVTKIMSNDVADSAWSAYLKGDRGVFTRRAVRLLDSGEVREIGRHYNEEPEFREQVNRYVRDFEAMLRNVLATRSGSPLGVTLLSSDMGKLYVALAQAIERLRN